MYNIVPSNDIANRCFNHGSIHNEQPHFLRLMHCLNFQVRMNQTRPAPAYHHPFSTHLARCSCSLPSQIIMSNNEFDFEELDYGDLGDIDTSDFDLEQFERELGLLSDEPRNGETSGQDAKPKPDSTVAKADNSKNDDNNNTKHESDASSDEHLVAIEASKQESIAKANDGDKPVVEEASSTVTKKTDVQQASDKLATNDGKEQGKSNENSLDTKTEEAKAHGDKHTLRNQSTDTKTHKATGNTHGKRPGYQRSIGYQHLQMNPYMAATKYVSKTLFFPFPCKVYLCHNLLPCLIAS